MGHRAIGRGTGRAAEVDVNGYASPCEIPLDDHRAPTGPTSFGLLAAALPVELREQLAAVVDPTPVTVLLRESLPIVTAIMSAP